MKNYFIIIITYFFGVTNLFSQENISTLTVSGQARLMVLPDITVINIELSSINKDYSLCINELQKKSEDLKTFLKSQGITIKYIKSENFQIDKQYDYANNERKFIGYSSKLFIRIELLNDNEKANKIINAIGTSHADADVSMKFEISFTKQDSINNILIENAIKDAQSKAEIIAKSTNQKLLKIEKINYGVNENFGFENNPSIARDYTAFKNNNIQNLTITPKEIEQKTQIIIYWQLTNNN